MERRRGEEEEMEIDEMEGKQRIRRGGGLVGWGVRCMCLKMHPACGLVCDERAVQPPVAIARYLAALLYAHDTYRSRQFLSVWLSGPAWRPDTAETEGILHSSLSHPAGITSS